MDYTPAKNIIIVGGSICGLMHGISLRRLGHNVRIVEQSSTSNRPSLAVGMGAGPYVQQWMEKHDRSKLPYSLPAGLQIINKASEVTRRFNAAWRMTSWDVLYYRLRANFDGLTSNHCPNSYVEQGEAGKGYYDFAKKVTSIEIAGDGTGRLEVFFDDLSNGSKGTIVADFVIAADGASSLIRQQLLHEPIRPYSGYVAWRGTVPEKEVSLKTVSLLEHHFSAFTMPTGYMVSYLIPGNNGSLVPGSRLVNYLWYYNVPEGSDEFANIMTDTDSHRHRHTLPVGKMQPAVWDKQKAAGVAAPLPKAYQESMAKTAQPFISAIRDTPPRGAVFLNKRLFLVGDAHTLFRPHVGASSNQAAFNCLELEKVFRGEITIEQWERNVTSFAKRIRALSVAIGDFFQKGFLAALPWILSFAWMYFKDSFAEKLSSLSDWVRGSRSKAHID